MNRADAWNTVLNEPERTMSRAEEWNAALDEPEELMLEVAKGKTLSCLVRRNAPLLEMVADGRIPAIWLEKREDGSGIDMTDPKTVASLNTVLNDMAVEVFIDPPVSLDGAPGTVKASKIPFGTRLFLLERVAEGLSTVDRFLDRGSGPRPASNGAGVRNATQPVPVDPEQPVS